MLEDHCVVLTDSASPVVSESEEFLNTAAKFPLYFVRSLMAVEGEDAEEVVSNSIIYTFTDNFFLILEEQRPFMAEGRPFRVVESEKESSGGRKEGLEDEETSLQLRFATHEPIGLIEDVTHFAIQIALFDFSTVAGEEKFDVELEFSRNNCHLSEGLKEFQDCSFTLQPK